MPHVAKVSISLPHELLRRVDAYCDSTGEGRSEFFRRSVIAYLEASEHREALRRYLDSYASEPEAAREIETIGAAGVGAIATESWD